MPGPMSEDARVAFLAEPHVAVLSVANGDRPPHASPVWYAPESDGTIVFFTGTQGQRSRKAELVERAGAVSLTVQTPTFPYRYVTVEGDVVGIERPPAAERALAIVRRYLPEEAAPGFVAAELARPAAESAFVLFAIRPTRWLSFDFADAA